MSKDEERKTHKSFSASTFLINNFLVFTQHDKSPAGEQEQREDVVVKALFVQRSGLTNRLKQLAEICKNNWNKVPLTPENASTVLHGFKWTLRTK